MQKATPLVPWLGGKRRLAKKILPVFKEHKTYVECFAGAAALYFTKNPVKTEVLNDVNGELINLYRIVQNHLDEFVRHFRWCLVSRDEFDRQLKAEPCTLTDIQRAVRFFYLQKLSFGAKLESPNFGTAASCPPGLNLLRIEEILSAAHLRLSRTWIERLDWMDCFLKYDREYTLSFLDPPYWQTEGYDVEFPFENYETMADMAKQAKGQVVITVNDIPQMREVFKDLRIVSVPIKYTVGGTNKGAPKAELIISNR